MTYRLGIGKSLTYLFYSVGSWVAKMVASLLAAAALWISKPDISQKSAYGQHRKEVANVFLSIKKGLKKKKGVKAFLEFKIFGG